MKHSEQPAKIAENSIVHPNVVLGEGVVIEDFCIIGYPPKGYESGELEMVIEAGTHIRSHCVLYAGTRIGKNCHISHGAYIREMCNIGDRTSIGINTIIEHHCRIGSDVRMQAQSGISEYTIVEDQAWIGPRVLTANVYHPTCERAKECLSGPVIRKGAIIGGNASIVPDIEVGEGAFVGLGAVVTKSVPDKSIAAGNPAKVVGKTDYMPCRYDMIEGDSPYAEKNGSIEQTGEPIKSEKKEKDAMIHVSFNDLAAHQLPLKQDIKLAMDRVILNTRYINGKEVKAFESQFSEYCGVAHTIGASSGTDALILALRSLNIGEGDEVITTSHTFIATAEAILAVNATPVFVDINDTTYHIDPEKIEEKVSYKTKAIIVVHIHGQPADMESIADIANRHGLKVIEDAAQAHGAYFADKRVGQWGDLACFSFFPGKNLGAFGDAGGVVTNSPELAELCCQLRDHGRVDKYRSTLIGVNARLDTLQAAILSVKLKHLDAWNDKRCEWAEYYSRHLEELPITLPQRQERATHVYHHYVIATDQRDTLQAYLKEHNIASGIHYPVPVHLQPAMHSFGYGEGSIPVTESIVKKILSLPLFPELKQSQADHVIETIKRFFKAK